ERAAPPARPAGPPTGRRARVLVVDDDPAVRELGAEMLARAGFEVLCAEGGAAALALIEGGEPIDAVLLDLAMPDLGGEATFLRLRASRPGLPVVLVSGYDAEQASQRFVARGLDGFLRKPFEPEQIAAAVAAALEARGTPEAHP
ncbi:MAG TPA: response regulator, partial [Myxococcota bacterium]|nr:response regulator [Myxococcota bacterium]